MSSKRLKFLSDALDLIEVEETRLLVWGIVDGIFSENEIFDIINPLIDKALEREDDEFIDPDKVFIELLRLNLIVEVEGADREVGYRSRMAETVRLLFRLRQLFPRHCRNPSGWQQAPSLVSDFRFKRRSRRYPVRDIPASETLKRLRSVTTNATILTGAQSLLRDNIKLSGFQVRAAERILRGIEEDKPLATIVCAGAGSGKTLAFYLPALASIIRHLLTAPDEHLWVKTVAIYPRSELLKDQLREIINRATGLCQALPSHQRNTRIRIGALFGDTPENVKYAIKIWKKSGQDLICPSLSCLKCNGILLWKHSDHTANPVREKLNCQNCDFFIDDSVFPLTRTSLKKFPPDILFTTTEMLNQRLSDSSIYHLFGVGHNALRGPETVLLDEVHTYEGRHGAQVAFLMRRWKRLVNQPIRFVGLSATLRDAASFFVSLTGAKHNLVEEISPRQDEIKSEGAEYMIALRGDPVSRAALLSTSMQTIMLLQRCLDFPTEDITASVSEGLFGQRTFVFTDDLDVTNRLYFNLMNAEGRNIFGGPDRTRAPEGGLAVLRRRGPSMLRYRSGQDWRMCEGIGHQLSARLNIDRVSSQDRGVSKNADVVVATAALEVGFDDPSVGAVVQHKAPISMAGFLQRKGRGGRSRGMRPWTAVVLSDYGRDRIVYQGYDLLFDPELTINTLPLTNRYITRMQAVYATIDYLGQQLEFAPPDSVWRDLSSPPWSHVRTDLLKKEIRFILDSDNGSLKLESYLRSALRLSKDEVLALLWEYPRPLMTTVLPTALRRLESSWRAEGERNSDYQVRNNPLPDFIPATLFSDLNLAEVRIGLPGVTEANYGDDHAMSVFSALKEYAPGKVSRRFGMQRNERHWLAPPDEALVEGGLASLDIDEVCTSTPVGTFSYWSNGEVVSTNIFRPIRMLLNAPPQNIADSSNAYLTWHTQRVPLGQPNWLKVPTGSVWSRLIPRIGFFMHAHHAPVEIRAFTTGSNAEVGIGRGSKIRCRVDFSKEQQAVGLGAAFSSDGVVFQVNIPEKLYEGNSVLEEKWRALRTARYFDRAWRGEVMRGVPSPFMRNWLAQVFISSLTYEAIQRNIDLSSAADNLINSSSTISFSEALSILFQSEVIEVEGEENDGNRQERLRVDLEALLDEPAILNELHELSRLLWEPITDAWEPWLRKVYQSTLAASIHRSIIDLCPSIDPANLVVDLDRGPPANDLASVDTNSVEIWITEKGPGGNGLIEEFMRRYAEDPRRFFSMVRSSLEVGEFELIDQQLSALLKVLVNNSNDSRTRELIQKYRASDSNEEKLDLFHKLRLSLVREGFSPFHGFLVSMANRILRSGAGLSTDRYLNSAIQKWDMEEARLGLEIDLSVICYWLSLESDINSVAADVGISDGQDGSWRMNAIYGLLWARGRDIRQSSLRLRNPFTELPQIERLLVIDSISEERERVSPLDSDWLKQVAIILEKGKQVTLMCDESKRSSLSEALNTLITNPIETGYLRAYARLQGIRQSENLVEADIELVEAVQ
jgi:hypothetical protein